MREAKWCRDDGLNRKGIGLKDQNITGNPVFFSFFIFPRDKSPSGPWACSDAAVQRCRCRIVPHAAVFPGALAWKERVERRVQRRQVRCKSTCGCNHVDLFLGHMCPPLCVFALFTDLTSPALPPPPPIDPLFHNVQRCVSSWNSRITWSGQVGICDCMDHHGGHDTCCHYIKTHLMQCFHFFGLFFVFVDSVGWQIVSRTKWTRMISAQGTNLKSQDSAGSS